MSWRQEKVAWGLDELQEFWRGSNKGALFVTVFQIGVNGAGGGGGREGREGF